MFIVLEGIDGSGKSTQHNRLVEYLRSRDVDVVNCADPASTPIGWRVREILQNKEFSPSPDADLLLFTAARVELWNKVISPALQDGKVVVCDRFVDSTFAYQIRGKERTQHEEMMFTLHNAFIGEYPDLTILIDLPVDVASHRLALRNTEQTRFESYNSNFFNRVRDGYLEAAQSNPRVLVIDGQDAEEAVFNQITDAVDACLRIADQR